MPRPTINVNGEPDPELAAAIARDEPGGAGARAYREERRRSRPNRRRATYHSYDGWKGDTPPED